MAELKYQPVPHDQGTFLKKAKERKGFQEIYDQLGSEYALVRELLAARSKAGLTQEAVAERMGTTKSAVSRLETAGKHSPSVATLKKYARAVGCEVEIRLVPAVRSAKGSVRTTRKRAAS
jgi:DNA-binding XRE family transcriptional regulator